MIPPGVASFASSLDDAAVAAAAAASMTNDAAAIASRVTNATFHQGARTIPLPFDDWPPPFLPCCMAAGCSPSHRIEKLSMSVLGERAKKSAQLSNGISLGLQLDTTIQLAYK